MLFRSGIDLEFDDDGCHYFVSIKSGTNWGNNAQQTEQQNNFESALRVYKQRQGQIPYRCDIGYLLWQD